jgi:KaiC/GvpD/RAD55 family RecA-like ATPase
LLDEPLPAGSNLLVEYDATSQWYRASLNIAREWLRAGGYVGYNLAAQLPDNLRSQISKLGVDVDWLEADGKLEVWDWYSATLGQKSKEKFVGSSTLKVSDLSIDIAREELKPAMAGETYPEYLRIWDNSSVMARFNDEKAWVEFMITRIFPSASYNKSTLIVGVLQGIHSDWVYKRLEDAADGVIDFRNNETTKGTADVLRIRSMRNVSFDREWHRLRIGKNLEVSLERRRSTRH